MSESDLRAQLDTITQMLGGMSTDNPITLVAKLQDSAIHLQAARNELATLNVSGVNLGEVQAERRFIQKAKDEIAGLQSALQQKTQELAEAERILRVVIEHPFMSAAPLAQAYFAKIDAEASANREGF